VAISAQLLKHATPAELAAYEEALKLELSLATPADYAEAVTGGAFLRPDHVEVISDTVTRLVEHRLLKPDGTPYRRLLVTMPPRHGKSETLSKYTPAWFLRKYPQRKVGLASYEADFAATWGKAVKSILEEAKDPLGAALDPSSRAGARWNLKAGGGMFTAGVGGPLTGKGFHLGIIDDPIKNAEEAASEVRREAVWDWFRSTFFSRMEPGGVIVLIQTRWHEDDLAGRCLREEPGEWFHLNIPAIAGVDDPLGRRPGEALWPERYSEEDLRAIQVTQGPYFWSALYQQSPNIEGGGIFRADRFCYYRKIRTPEGVKVRVTPREGPPKLSPLAKIARFATVDLAVSKKNSADWTVIATWGVTPDKELLLLDRYRARIEGSQHMDAVQSEFDRWKHRFVGVERATYGITLLQTAARIGKIPMIELKPDFDKVTRAYGAGALVEAGRVYFPEDAPWLHEFTAELLAFPNGTHDDQVDAFSYAAKVLSDRLHALRPPKEAGDGTYDAKVWAYRAKRRRKPKVHPQLGAF
jgi:predicted phage terminase large subunit-like protein